MTHQLIGHGAALLNRFADDLQRSFGGPPFAKARAVRLNRHRVGRLSKGLGAGGSFEVLLVDDEGQPTGYIAKVTVSYSRFDEVEANAAHRQRCAR